MSVKTDSECMRVLNDSKSLTIKEKELVAIIVNNMRVRGLIWSETDEVIATTECIVLANCLRDLRETIVTGSTPT